MNYCTAAFNFYWPFFYFKKCSSCAENISSPVPRRNYSSRAAIISPSSSAPNPSLLAFKSAPVRSSVVCVCACVFVCVCRLVRQAKFHQDAQQCAASVLQDIDVLHIRQWSESAVLAVNILLSLYGLCHWLCPG